MTDKSQSTVINADNAERFASSYAAGSHGEEWNSRYMKGLDICGYCLQRIDDDVIRPFGTVDAPAPAGFKQAPPRKPGLVTPCGYPYPSIIVRSDRLASGRS